MKTGLFVRITLGIVVIGVLAISLAPIVVADEEAYAKKQATRAARKDVPREAVRREYPIVTDRAGKAAEAASQAARLNGTITYDDGVVNVAPTVTGDCYGNRFNTALNPAGTAAFPVQASGSITMVSFFMVSVSTTGYITFADQLNTVAGTAMKIDSGTYAMSAGWNTVTLVTPSSYVGSSFLGGVWFSFSSSVGLGTGTTGGQGHHGMHIGTGTTTMPGYTPSTTFNALFRPSGDLLTPVELMSFTVTND